MIAGKASIYFYDFVGKGDYYAAGAFLQRMQEMLGEEYPAFLESYEHEKYQALRVNALKAGRGKVDGESQKLPFHLTPVPWAENGYYYEKDDQPGKHPYHEAGVYYIQEPSAMAPVSLLDVNPGDRVLDLCAAPGGKSTQIAALLMGEGLLVCNEIHPARAKILSENVERMGICNALVLNETPEHLAQLFPEYFDRILVDAPCSGEGMFRKNEDACGEWSPENVALCAQRQDGILDCAAKMLRPGGKLVYSTCTFAPQEDEGSVMRFLERDPSFFILPFDRERLGLAEAESEGKAEYLKFARVGRGIDSDADQCGVSGLEAGSNREGAGGSETSDREKQTSGSLCDTLRLWPHHIKGEGHYAAVLQKSGDAAVGYRPQAVTGVSKAADPRECKECIAFLEEILRPVAELQSAASAADFAESTACVLTDALLSKRFLRFGDQIYLMPEQLPGLKGLKVLRPGLHLGTLKKNRFEPSHALALALSPEQVRNVWNFELDDDGAAGRDAAESYLNGLTFSAEGEKGWYLICVDGFSLGWGKLAGGMMKNHYPKGLRKN